MTVAERRSSASRRNSVFGCPPRTLAKFGLGIDRRPTHNSPMNKLYYERADYSVVVKNRAPPPKAWRWEIYRAGNVSPIKQSSVYFDTTAAAASASLPIGCSTCWALMLIQRSGRRSERGIRPSYP